MGRLRHHRTRQGFTPHYLPPRPARISKKPLRQGYHALVRLDARMVWKESRLHGRYWVRSIFRRLGGEIWPRRSGADPDWSVRAPSIDEIHAYEPGRSAPHPSGSEGANFN